MVPAVILKNNNILYWNTKILVYNIEYTDNNIDNIDVICMLYECDRYLCITYDLQILLFCSSVYKQYIY